MQKDNDPNATNNDIMQMINEMHLMPTNKMQMMFIMFECN